MRKITITESDDKNLPSGYAWKYQGRSRGYSVRYSAGSMSTRMEDFPTLTDARRHARRIVRSGKAWAEVFKWCESYSGIRKVFIASYEVELESGSAVA